MQLPIVQCFANMGAYMETMHKEKKAVKLLFESGGQSADLWLLVGFSCRLKAPLSYRLVAALFPWMRFLGLHLLGLQRFSVCNAFNRYVCIFISCGSFAAFNTIHLY